MIKFLLDSIKMISGLFLISLLIIVWIINIIFGSIVAVVTWIELKIANAMRKCLDNEDLV